MSIDIIFKLAAIGIITAVLSQLLTKWGRDDIAIITGVVGLIVAMLTAIEIVNDFFQTVKSVFRLY